MGSYFLIGVPGRFIEFIILMKNFRSSKNLRAIDPSSKEESALRLKVKCLEEQIELLQKSNLNIFIPLSEHEAKNSPNLQAIINKLKTQILGLQQEVQRQKSTIKKLQTERQVLRIAHQNEKVKLQEQINSLQQEKESLSLQIHSLEEDIVRAKHQQAELQKVNIELKVQNRFLTDDIANCKKRIATVEKKHEELHSMVLEVSHYSKIYNSKKVRVVAIEARQLDNLKSYIEQLERKLKQMIQSNRQEKITLGVRRQNIGEEIVRLKKNIDLQLGLPLNEQSTQSFLEVYKGTTACFDDLIRDCKR